MEHFEKRWVKRFSNDYGWQILVKEGRFSFIGTYGMENDPYGAKTAQRICDYHNLVVPALRALVKDLENFGYVDFTEMTDTQTYELVQKAIDAIGRIGE